MQEYNFERLEVWQKAVEFADNILALLDEIETTRKHYRLFEQMESACTSIPMNIAEGKGRYSRKEFKQFLYIARGSLFEVVTLLTIFQKRKWISAEKYNSLKDNSFQIGKMLSGLINSLK